MQKSVRKEKPWENALALLLAVDFVLILAGVLWFGIANSNQAANRLSLYLTWLGIGLALAFLTLVLARAFAAKKTWPRGATFTLKLMQVSAAIPFFALLPAVSIILALSGFIGVFLLMKIMNRSTAESASGGVSEGVSEDASGGAEPSA